jgi:hypothetical protein
MLQTLDTNREFEALARRFFAEHPEIRHEWRQIKSALSGGRTDIICEPGTSREVFASLTTDQITVGVDSAATDFEDFGRGLTSEQVAKEAFAHFETALREKGII